MVDRYYAGLIDGLKAALRIAVELKDKVMIEKLKKQIIIEKTRIPY